MRHIEEERFAVLNRVFERFERLARERFGQMHARAVILGHVLHGEHVPLLGSVAVVVLALVAAGHTRHVARHVDDESHIIGARARRTGRRPMRLPHMNGKITGVFEQLRQRRGVLRMFDSRNRTHPVDVPCRTNQSIRRILLDFAGFHRHGAARRIAGRIPRHSRPVGNSRMGGVHARQQAGTRRRRDRTGVRAGQDDAFAGQTIHVGRMKPQVVRIDLLAVGHRAVRPTHIVHEKKDDIGLIAFRQNGGGSQQRQAHP